MGTKTTNTHFPKSARTRDIKLLFTLQSHLSRICWFVFQPFTTILAFPPFTRTLSHTGDVDSGKSTLIGRMKYEIGDFTEKHREKLTTLAYQMGRGSFQFAFFTDKIREERERGITIRESATELLTAHWQLSLIDCPGHRYF